MPIVEFPPVENADEQGLLAIGGDLHHDSLLLSYKNGIFPWPISEEYPLAWFSPPDRGIIKIADIQVAKSLKKFLKKTNWTISFNNNFLEVIRNCQAVHSESLDGTWITDEIVDGYHNFFHQGYAYCCEVRNERDELIGGLYGVKIGKLVSGESMFYKQANASKVALLGTLAVLKEEDVPFLDTQMVTPITESFGAKNMDRSKFVKEVGRLVEMKTFEFSKEISTLDLLKRLKL